MTTTSLDPAALTAERAGSGPSPNTTVHGADFATAAITTSRRSILQFFRTPQVLMMGSIQGALFLFMFRYVFGGAIQGSLPSGLSYVDFLVPGFLVTVILWSGMSAAAGVAEDGASGVYDRLRSLPIPRASVTCGRSIADFTLMAWGMFITAIVGLLVGFRTHGSVGKVILGVLVMLAFGYCFTWVFIFIGLVAENAQAAQGMTMLVIPFSFISSANVPVETMPGWMQPFARNQPVSVAVNAVRSLMQGGTKAVGLAHSTTYWVVLTAIWGLVILGTFGALSVRRFSKLR
jgi:ABC-2 type transport system permease protein